MFCNETIYEAGSGNHLKKDWPEHFLLHNLVCRLAATAEINVTVLTWLSMLASPLATSRKLVMMPSWATPLLVYCLERLVEWDLWLSRKLTRLKFVFVEISFPIDAHGSVWFLFLRPASFSKVRPSGAIKIEVIIPPRSLELWYQTELYHCSFASLYRVHPLIFSTYASISSINPWAILPPSHSQRS